MLTLKIGDLQNENFKLKLKMEKNDDSTEHLDRRPALYIDFLKSLLLIYTSNRTVWKLISL